jgi:hypothetical protein
LANTQQEALVYKNKAFSPAQRQFEKDLSKRQKEGWRLVSVTPTHNGTLTAIYERDTTSSDDTLPNNQFSYREITKGKDNKKQNSAYSKMKEAIERAAEKEREYQKTLNPEQLRKRKRRNIFIGCSTILVALLLCIGMTIAANASNQSSAEPTPVVSASTAQNMPTPTPSPTAKPTPTPVPYAHFGDGTFVVGKDIQPGTYRTREASPGCYYARLKGFGGTVDDIIANDNTDYPAIVTISRTDKGFESENCGTWTKDLSAITHSKTSFGDGMYIVGTDIKPGTYKSSGQSGCYYARLSGFGGTIDDIIANDNTDTPAIVTISAGDKGFQSNNCGTWTKM